MNIGQLKELVVIEIDYPIKQFEIPSAKETVESIPFVRDTILYSNSW
jgi:hypothetical protein